ncbi:hypothetical protein HNQ56_001066 [Anaerotaenia torta]|uniref:PilZ domain-containing protein n=1 Tax=Anaerotaenia torta TaxID=433293 RepID=UPI003D22CF5F
MEERRRAKRMPVKLSLEILNLYKQNHVEVSNLNAPIEVINISKSGIGFRAQSVLPLGYYFNASIDLGTGEILHSVVEIVRSQEDGDAFLYGCAFVGMADVLSFIFDDYDEKIGE